MTLIQFTLKILGCWAGAKCKPGGLIFLRLEFSSILVSHTIFLLLIGAHKPFAVNPPEIRYQVNPLYWRNYCSFGLNKKPTMPSICWIYDAYLKRVNCVQITTTMPFESLHLMFAVDSFCFFAGANFPRLTTVRHPFGRCDDYTVHK